MRAEAQANKDDLYELHRLITGLKLSETDIQSNSRSPFKIHEFLFIFLVVAENTYIDDL
jgi:hypothetical protein